MVEMTPHKLLDEKRVSMASTAKQPNGNENPNQAPSLRSEQAVLVLQELDRILESKFFKSSERSRQFLRYVVQHKLEGQSEQLKERTIGAEIFQRTPGYATGDDPVVRV